MYTTVSGSRKFGSGSRHPRRYAHPTTDREAELETMLEAVGGAGLVETYVDETGRHAMRLTADGERVARQMAMSSEDEQDALLAALVEAKEADS